MTSAIPVQRSNQLTYQANWELVSLVSQRSWVRLPFKPEFFQVSSFQLFKLKHLHCDDLHIILSLSAVQIHDYFIYSYSFLHLRDKYELLTDQLPVGLIGQLVRALHWYRRGHGFDSRSSLNFFQVSSFQLFKLKHLHCDDLHIIQS